ncbi:MAG: SDR family NAD(P)-dependent oxidoreductase, partial [Alphaproteobacteria bacterium]|nr:SDR family NAD(P)-dependent oxidoreductase [Alphaproteobacteria bacterium]
TGDGVTGRLKTMIRPESKVQTPLKDLKALRLDGCSGQRALIVGASRGIGLQCLRLLGLSGAETLFTFFRNKQEAENIQSEFSENGLTTDFIQFDVTSPSREALEYIARFRPTHLYYFATPKISIGTGALSEDRFNGFAHTYIFALDNLIKETQDLKAVFAPSSVAIDELPKDMVEYAFAKAAMEVYAHWMEKSRKLRFYTPRFPRIETDQTQSVLSVPAEKAENVLSRELSIFLNQKKDDEK